MRFVVTSSTHKFCALLSLKGPFVHVASLCAALLSKLMAALFGGIFMVSKADS